MAVMATPELELSRHAGTAMDRRIQRHRWSPAGWPLAAQLALAGFALLLVAAAVLRLVAGTGARTVRLPAAQVTIATVEQGIFHDLIPLRTQVVPRETVYIDAIDGGRVDRVLVEPGDVVAADQPMIELSNTNLALSIIQQESQLNQAISQLQQNEIALEQNKLANDRALAEIDYGLVRLERSAGRREGLVAQGATSAEQRDVIADELAYYQHLRPIQADSGKRQSDLRERLLPDIHRQLANLRGNLDVVHGKLDGLIIRAPLAGRVTAIDLKVGEHRNPGQRLAEVTPDAGMKLSAEVDEFYLARVRTGQSARVDFDGVQTQVSVKRVSPQVKNGQFTIDLDFDAAAPRELVAGEAAQGRLQLGGDTPARILAVGPFLERTGGNWAFVVAADGQSAERRRVKVGRRTTEQLEILGGLAAGERVITSDYTGLEKADRVVLIH
jgi:HlyD family secretion protein